MFLVRLVGSLFLLIAALSLIHDGGVTFSHNKGILITPIGQHWFDVSPASLDAAEQAVRNFSPWLWDTIVLNVLFYPAWAVFGLLGLVICYAGRKRERINIYAN